MRHRFQKAALWKNAGGMLAASALCENHPGQRAEGRNATAESHAVAALHSCIVPRQCILPFTQTTFRRYPLSADAPRGTAVESSPQKASAPAQVFCDRLRPSKNCQPNYSGGQHKSLAENLPVSPFVVAMFLAPPKNANETALPCTAIAQVHRQAPA
jgi:hypothetical protein